MTSIGIVVIGRNEGERLRRCLSAVRETTMPCVYVDSGSTDGSVELAEAIVGSVIQLDASQPFTAARGRNEGFRHLLKEYPELVCVQFVDGDCELEARWLARAGRELVAHPELGIVCGKLREAKPDASVYNQLCELEWTRPTGVTAACGGIFMVRAEAFREVGGFDHSLASGEEPDLCLRLRRRGWTIRRIDAPMAVHDAAMYRFGEWWRRAVRSGRSVMQSVCRGSPRAEWRDVRRVLSIVLWTVGLPAAIAALAWPSGGWSLLLALAYPIQWVRLWWRYRTRLGVSARVSRIGASFTLLAKAAEFVGIAQVAGAVLMESLSHATSTRNQPHLQSRRSHAQS